MIGLDTNVVIRYLVQDEPDHAAAADALIESLTETEPGYLSLVTVVELHWVLHRAYKRTNEQCAELIAGLLASREVRIDREDIVRAALGARVHGVDFADAVIAELGRSAGCAYTATFDRKAARSDAMGQLST